jgi:hypothetical protein
LDRDRFDDSHVKLVFSACLHPESQLFEVRDPGDAHGCYQIRPRADIGSGFNYHLLFVTSGPVPNNRGWTPILSGPCSSFSGQCSHDFQTWVVQKWPNGTYKIRSNKAVEGYPLGWCMDKRDDSGEGAPEPQYLDCRNDPLQQFLFEPTNLPLTQGGNAVTAVAGQNQAQK